MLLLSLPGYLFADSIVRPFPWSIESASGQYVFVMLPEGDLWREDGTPERLMDKKHDVYSSYSVSGLYRNDGSTDPLWAFDGYLYSAHILDDGRHLIAPAVWASDMDSRAVAFYREGELLRYWRVRDLVHFKYIHPHSISHFNWQEDASWDAQEAEYTILTMEGYRYTFDPTTGEMKASDFQWDSASLLLRWCAVSFVASLIALGSIYSVRRFRKRHLDASMGSATLHP
ncbi:MAG: hypothetical protein R3E76_03600 [Planctomycetota bacterium]